MTVRNKAIDIFRSNLSRLLQERKMTQREFAKLVGVSAPTVNDWLSGKTSPRMTKIDKICSILSVKRSDLLDAPKAISVEINADISRLVSDDSVKAHLKQYLSLNAADRATVDRITSSLASEARDVAKDSMSSTAEENEIA